MSEVAEKLATAITIEVDRMAIAAARPLRSTADHLDEAPSVVQKAENDGLTEIRGKDRRGRLAVFSPDQVETDILRDSQGRRGIEFPTQPSDRSDSSSWMRRATEKIDREFSHLWPVTRVSDRKPDWVPESTPQPIPGVGTGAAPTERGILVISHANPSGFAVRVRTIGPPDRRPCGLHGPMGSMVLMPYGSGQMKNSSKLVYPSQHVFLGGAEYGRLLAAKKPELEAAAETPDSPVRLVSCSSAAPEGDAAESAASSMQQNGVLRDVQAGTGDMLLHRDASGTARIGIAGRGDPEGNVVPPWRNFPVTRPGNTG
ncbi:MAG: hypothetical protein HOQ44_23735 [Nocardia sp.]|nr:hypothetical protein [Nocardia sp.]